MAVVVLLTALFGSSGALTWSTKLREKAPAVTVQRPASSRQLNAQLEKDMAELLETWSPRHIESPSLEALRGELGLAHVRILVLASSPFGRATSLPGLIVLDESLLSAPRAALAFVLAHEYGHLQARHWQQLTERAGHLASATGSEDLTLMLRLANRARPLEAVHAEELEADRLARELLERRGLWSGAEVRRFFEEVLWSDGSESHPATVVRLRALGLEH